MDSICTAIAEHVADLRTARFDDSVLEATKDRVTDAVACMYGGFDGAPSRIARASVEDVVAEAGAIVCGTARRSALRDAAFANTVMVRYLDFNDMFVFSNGSHPSDTIPALLACAEYGRASGSDFLAAVVGAYEILAAFGAAQEDGHQRGWDQGVGVSIAAAAAGAMLLGCDVAQIGHAISIAAVSNVSLRQTRVGELSHWKGCATAAAASNGVFAARLALAGMTGPPAPFEGKNGLVQLVTGPIKFRIPIESSPALLRSIIKRYPCVYPAQAIIQGLVAHASAIDPADIERVDVATTLTALRVSAGDPKKWRPVSRETADHSLPYLIASAIREGDVSIDSFKKDRWHDQKMLALMDKVAVSENADFTEQYPVLDRSTIEITFRQGETIAIAIPEGIPAGSRLLSTEDVKQKATLLMTPRLGAEAAGAVLDVIGGLNEAREVHGLLRPVIDPGDGSRNYPAGHRAPRLPTSALPTKLVEPDDGSEQAYVHADNLGREVSPTARATSCR